MEKVWVLQPHTVVFSWVQSAWVLIDQAVQTLERLFSLPGFTVFTLISSNWTVEATSSLLIDENGLSFLNIYLVLLHFFPFKMIFHVHFLVFLLLHLFLIILCFDALWKWNYFPDLTSDFLIGRFRNDELRCSYMLQTWWVWLLAVTVILVDSVEFPT